MKRLILVRHAKSSWNYEVGDKDRPLKERGINDAYLVANHLSKKGYNIEAVFSSPANRALHTCIIFLRTLGVDFNVLTVTNNLYDFSGGSVLNFIKSLDNSLQTVMIFGHNHAFTSVANQLGNEYIDNVTTSGTVVIDFDEDNWENITKGKTNQIIFPKHLK